MADRISEFIKGRLAKIQADTSPPWRDVRSNLTEFMHQEEYRQELRGLLLSQEVRKSPDLEEEYVILDMEGNCTSLKAGDDDDMPELVDSVSGSEDDGMPALEGPEFSKEERLSIMERAAKQHGIKWGDGSRDVVEKVVHAIVSNQLTPHWVHSDSSLNDLD